MKYGQQQRSYVSIEIPGIGVRAMLQEDVHEIESTALIELVHSRVQRAPVRPLASDLLDVGPDGQDALRVTGSCNWMASNSVEDMSQIPAMGCPGTQLTASRASVFFMAFSI